MTDIFEMIFHDLQEAKAEYPRVEHFLVRASPEVMRELKITIDKWGAAQYEINHWEMIVFGCPVFCDRRVTPGQFTLIGIESPK